MKSEKYRSDGYDGNGLRIELKLKLEWMMMTLANNKGFLKK
jgi:hypothetical protein